MMSKLKNKIHHSFLSTQAKTKDEGENEGEGGGEGEVEGEGGAKGKGDQWWLKKAPWFLPPPPEWGPMPVTMYTSYYHKPTHPFHQDYAHGIPLPQAAALNLARHTYPQPPFEVQQAAADSSFMELSSEQHEELLGPDHGIQTEQQELDDAALDATLIQMAESSMANGDAESEHSGPIHEVLHQQQQQQTASSSSIQQQQHQEQEHGGHFFLEADADKATLGSEAVEAVEVDDLAHASPLSGELLFSTPI
jgi:hypothetical protein